jgi:hypothetical protein
LKAAARVQVEIRSAHTCGVGPFSTTGHQPLVTYKQANQGPERRKSGVCKQKAGDVRFGNLEPGRSWRERALQLGSSHKPHLATDLQVLLGCARARKRIPSTGSGWTPAITGALRFPRANRLTELISSSRAPASKALSCADVHPYARAHRLELLRPRAEMRPC